MPIQIKRRHSREGGNPVFLVGSGFRIKCGMTNSISL